MPRILGLDIDHDALRGVLLRTSFRNVEVQQYVQVPLSAAPDSPARAPEVADAYQSLLRSLGAPPDSVITSLDGLTMSLHTVELPTAAAKRVADVLPFELETLLPFDPEDAVIAHQTMPGPEGTLRLLVAAALEERVDVALQRLKLAGIDPDELGAGGVALDGLAGLMPESLGHGVQLLLEVRRAGTDLCLLSDGRCVLARSLSVGTDALDKNADSLWQEIKRTLATARAGGLDAPARATLVGEGALASGMASWLASHLDLEVQLAVLPEPSTGSPPSPLFGRALALAGRTTARGAHIDLRVGRFASSRSGAGLAVHGTLLAGCAFATLLSMIFSLNASQQLLLDEQAQLQDELAELTKQVLGTEASTAEATEALIEAQAKRKDPLPRFDAFDALAAISETVRPDVVHEVRQMRIEVGDDRRDGRVELQGELASLEQRDALVANLQAHACFDGIEKGRTRPSRDKARINYQIEADLHCGGDKKKKR